VCLFHVFTNYSPNNLSRAHDLTDPAAQFAGFLGASSCSDMCDYKYLYGKCKKYINEDVLKMFAMRAAVHCLEWSQLVEFGMGINADLHNEVVGIENTSKWLPEAANEPFSVMVLCGALAAHHQSMVDQLIADHLVSNLDLEDVLAKDIVILKDTVYRVASDIRKQSFDLYRRRCREDQHCPNVERCEEFIQLLMDQTEGFTFYMGQSMLTILMRIMTENPNSSLRDYYDHLLADGWDMTHVDPELVLTIWKQMGWS
jgi:hypothetical protein